MRRFMTYGLVALLMASSFVLTGCGETEEEEFEREIDEAVEEFNKEMDKAQKEAQKEFDKEMSKIDAEVTYTIEYDED